MGDEQLRGNDLDYSINSVNDNNITLYKPAHASSSSGVSLFPVIKQRVLTLPNPYSLSIAEKKAGSNVKKHTSGSC
jgi:hypothetical protein